MSVKESNGRFELVSGEAVLSYNPAQTGHYGATYSVHGKPVFTSVSFCGGTFEFLVETVTHNPSLEASLQLAGQWHSAGQGGSWQGQASTLEDKPGWFGLVATFELTESLKLAQASRAPGLALSLSKPRQPGQTVLVSQPTEHNPPIPWLRSNDLPAAYLWDELTQTETLVFPDLEGCNWFQHEGLNRLADYRCTLAEDGQTFGFVLRPDSAQRPTLIPAGSYTLSFRLYLGPRTTKPDDWQAVRYLIKGCAELLPGAPVIPPPTKLSWLDLERQGREELMQPGLCWLEDAVRGYVAYVQEPSQLERNGGPVDERIEAMASLDILPPWLAALRRWPNQTQQDHLLKVAASLLRHYSPQHQIFVNQVDMHTGLPLVRHPQTQLGPAYGDSWYFFEPLLRLGWCAHLIPPGEGELAQNLQQIFLLSCRRAIDFIQKHDYRPAAFYDPLSLAPFNYPIPAEAEDPEIAFWTGTVPDGSRPWLNWLNTSQNWACLGLYAYIMLQAHSLSGEVQFQAEARKALAALGKCPPDTLFWEPFEISYGVAAAAWVGETELATNLAANLLRMGYWQDETGLPGPTRPRRGLFQAWAGIRYPAQKENGETLLPLLAWLQQADQISDQAIVKAALKFFNLARSSAFCHYSHLINETELYPGRIDTPTPHIPLEDVEMFEWCPAMHLSKSQSMPQPGQASGAIGREIYGAGETTWFALMFEALAEPSDSRVLVLNLDLFDWDRMAVFPHHQEQNFIVYNPAGPLELAIHFKALEAGAKYRLRYGEHSLIIAADDNGQITLQNLELAKDQWLRLELQLQGELLNERSG